MIGLLQSGSGRLPTSRSRGLFVLLALTLAVR
jgi:hypothetical protein